jgi:acetoacetate decarboxylase
MTTDNAPKTNPGDIIGWPILKIDYPTQPEKIAALLPPGVDPGAEPSVHLSIYRFPVPDEPENGIVVSVDADYRGTQGVYPLAYGIDQESAIFISRDMNGQPKYPCEITYYRVGPQVVARCSHQGYTFVEYKGQSGSVLPNPAEYVENEWWVKVSRAVGGAEKAYDFPPHLVRVQTTYRTVYQEAVDGDLLLRESPWDPIQELLPVEGEVSARLWTAMMLGREITLEAPLDPDAFWPHVDTISGSRWPGSAGGPRRS